MNRVYRNVASTYGKNWGIWYSFTSEFVGSLFIRIFSPLIFSKIIGAVVTDDIDYAKKLLLIYFLFAVIGRTVRLTGDLVGLKSENKVYEGEVLKFYERLTRKDMAFYRNQHTGYLTTAYRHYLDSGILIIRTIRSDVIRSLLYIVAPGLILLYYSWRVGVAVLVITVIQLIYVRWSSAKANEYRERSHEIYKKVSGEVADDITNIVAYKSSGMEEESLSRIKDLRMKETELFWLRRKVTTLLDYPRAIVTGALITFIFWIIVDLNTGLSDQVELFVLSMTYVFGLLRAVDQVPSIISRLDDQVTRMDGTMDIMSKEYNESILDKANAQKLMVNKGEIKFRDVDFKYSDHNLSKYIFKNFSLQIAAGQSIGIVGLSGAGKSTLANLLMRFEDVTNGSVEIDGQDVKDVTQSSLRRGIAYVTQEPLLFHRSVKDNITYGNKANKVALVKSAKAAHAHEFIEELPDGYDTVVGERGVKLSGGQKQRVVIARAVMKNAPILLFDEATSALDSESEEIIQNALPEIIGSHTAIIIAHRLSTVAGLDRIIVINKGKIIEDGTHKQLLAKKGRYFELWRKQTKSN